MTRQRLDVGTGDGDVARSPSGGPFLHSKLDVPPLPASWVPRSRLHARLSRGVERPLTVLSAPAGTGKSLLAASWARSGDAPGTVVWLTLDEDDDDPETFWFSVLQALRDARVTLSMVPALSPAGARTVDRGFLAALAYGFAEREEPVVLVIDEFDTVADRRVGDGLEFVLRRSGHGLRLVLLGRRDPLLPLHRYRLHEELTEIRVDELAFTRAETEQVLGAHGVHLSTGAVGALLERTEGWVVGVRLTAMTLQSNSHQPARSPRPALAQQPAPDGGERDAERFVADFAADDRTIADYLVGEVLDAVPADARELLLCTSLVERVHPDLADALTGSTESARALAALERSNSFVSHIPSAPGWYRFHGLFRDVVRAQLAYERPELVPELHRRAARWLGQQGQLDQAVAHAAAAGEWAMACSLVVDQLALGALLAGHGGSRVAELLGSMPADEPGAEPAVIRAAIALSASDVDACEQALDVAEHALLRARPVPRTSVRLAVSVVGSVLARLRGDALLAVANARRARSLMREATAPLPSEHPELAAILASTEGSALTWAGDLTGAERVLTASVTTGNGQLGVGAAAVGVLGDLAVVESVRGRLQRAARFGREAVAGSARGAGLFASHEAAAGHLALAWVFVEEYDLDSARRAGEHAARALADGRDPLLSAGLGLVRARLLSLLGDTPAALAALAAAGRDVRGADVSWPPAWLARQLALTTASVHLAAGTPDDALAVLEPLADDSVEFGVAAAAAWLASGDADRARTGLRPLLDRADGDAPLATRVEGWLLEGRMLAEGGRLRAATQAAGQALRLAQPEKLRRPFAEENTWLRHALRHDAALSDAHAWLGPRLVPRPRRPLPLESSDERVGDTVLVEPLSRREREVLTLLAQMMSTEEIASALFLSHNTVKTHLKSIYRKLSASRRGEAVRRARRLGLLPQP